MGLDVYVGSLTRYFLESPATVIEQMARQQRIPYTIVRHQNGSDGAALEQVTRAAVLAWREGLYKQLGERLDGPLEWDESPDGPHFTDKPRWDGYGGAVLLAAHVDHPKLPLPDDISADWPDDPVYLAAISQGTVSRFDQVLFPELWLPCAFGFTFRTQDATGQEIEVGSSPVLLRQLEALRAEHPCGCGTLDPVAHAGLAVLLRMAERSVAHHVPMMLDF